MEGKHWLGTMGKRMGIGGALALGLYALLVPLGALLVAGETVGQEHVAVLCAVFAAVAAGFGAWLALRGVKSGRMPLCLGVAAVFLLALLVPALAGEGTAQAWIPAVGALAGAAAAAMTGGGKRKKRKGKRR